MNSLYAGTGFFALAESLAERGSFSPARKVFLIARSLSMVAASGLNPAKQDDALESVLDDALNQSTAMFADKALVPLSALRLSSEPTWDPYIALSELMLIDCGAFAMRSVKHRLNAAGVGLSYPELHDIATAFANAHLCTAVRSFDPVRGEGKEGAWLSTVLYRFALRHALLAHRLEANFALAFDVADPSPLPDELFEAKSREAALQILPAAVSHLPRVQQKAIVLYFGLSGREHAVREVAARLKTNPYYARLAISSGVVSLAVELGAGGLLSAEELSLARILLEENEDVDSAARKLGKSRSEIRRQVSLVARKVASSLRRRTVLPRSRTYRGASEMANETDLTGLYLADDIIHGRLTLEHKGNDVLVSGGHLSEPISIEFAREVLISQLDKLTSAGTQIEADLAAIFAPQGTRDDISEEDEAWGVLLFKAVEASRYAVVPLVERFKEEAQNLNIPIAFDDNELTERVRDSLATVTAALEQAMPRHSRKKGTGLVWIKFGEQPEDAIFGWEQSTRGEIEPVSLLDLVHHRLSVVGDFDGAELTLLADCVVAGLQQGWATLPRFTRVDTHNDTLRLSWKQPHGEG